MTMPKRTDPSQEKLLRVKTRTGDPQSGYLEEKLAGSKYVNIIEEDGASGKRLRIELDGASVSAEISDHKVKVDNADTAEYLGNKITAGDNITVSTETSGGKKNIKISALIPGVNASEECVAIEIQEIDYRNIIKASKKLPANCVITKVMCVGDMEFEGAGALNVGVVNADGDKGAVIGSIDFIRSYALYTEFDPYLRYKAVANFTLELPSQSQLNPVEPITAGSEINVVVYGGTATGSCIIYIFYCVPMG